MGAIFVHLSDIHFGQEKSSGDFVVNSDARERLIEDAAVVMKAIGRRADGIIVTGDIAYSGKQTEYRDAGKWLDSLAEKVGGEIYEIQMVPGNHDIDRAEITSATQWMIDEVVDKGETALNSFLDKEGDRELLYRRFKAYRDFAQGYRCPLDCTGASSTDFRVSLAPNRALRFIRLNSALICSGKDAKGSLILGERQRVIPRKPGEETVVLTHHPVNWFQDSVQAKRYLRGRARVVISGHEHYPSLSVENVEAGSDLMLLAAGATTPDGRNDDVFTYKYNIIEFDWNADEDALAVTVHPRTWDHEFKRFDEDTEFLAGKNPTTILSSPNFRDSPIVENIATASNETESSRPEIETVSNPIAGGDQQIVSPTADQKLLQLRFFRDLTEGERLKVLLDLQMIPDDLQDALDHEMERLLFTELFKRGLGEELKTMIGNILTHKKGSGE